MTFLTNTIFGFRLPDGRTFTVPVGSAEPPTLLAALRALHQAKRSLEGKRLTPSKVNRPPDGLLTLQQAATKLGTST